MTQVFVVTNAVAAMGIDGVNNNILTNFVSGSTRILITTDVMARGIDVQQISIVINYDMPEDDDTYLHRVITFIFIIN